jgi:hypothetical protein
MPAVLGPGRGEALEAALAMLGAYLRTANVAGARQALEAAERAAGGTPVAELQQLRMQLNDLAGPSPGLTDPLPGYLTMAASYLHTPTRARRRPRSWRWQRPAQGGSAARSSNGSVTR